MLKHEIEVTLDGLNFKAIAPPDFTGRGGEMIHHEVRVADLVEAGDPVPLLLFAVFMKLAQIEDRAQQVRSMPPAVPDVGAMIEQFQKAGLIRKPVTE